MPASGPHLETGPLLVSEAEDHGGSWIQVARGLGSSSRQREGDSGPTGRPGGHVRRAETAGEAQEPDSPADRPPAAGVEAGRARPLGYPQPPLVRPWPPGGRSAPVIEAAEFVVMRHSGRGDQHQAFLTGEGQMAL